MKREARLACVQIGLALTTLLPGLASAIIALPQLELVADINQTPSQTQSDPKQFTALGSTVIFVATSAAEGRELWKTDGTANGTVIVKDIRPGNLSSNPIILGVVGTTAYFSANDGVYGTELWKTDGTAAGTVMVKDIYHGSESGNPQRGAAHQGLFYFTAQDYDRNYELWKTDGTDNGTVMVTDLKYNTVNPGSGPANYVSTGTTLFFTANNDSTGTELYKTDGTAGGTVLVKDITPGSSSNFIGSMVAMNGVLYFSANDGTNGLELWKSDGTTAGTVMVKNINAGSASGAPSGMVANGNTLYFSANSAYFNSELWKSDGTDAGTVLVKEIRPGTGSFQGSDPFGFKAVGSLVYFFANDGSTGVELYKTDGTAGGTVMVKDLLPGSGSGARVTDPSTAPAMLEAIGTTVFFYGTNGTASGGELWKTDGTDAGTTMVKELGAGSASAVIREMKAIGSKLYFSAVQPAGGTEPYVSDGTSGGTSLLKDISAATADSTPKELTSAGGKLFFSANDGVNGRELWVVDGTGVHMTRTLNYTTADNSLSGLGAMNGTLYFGSSTNNANNDFQLFRSDGTQTGTFLVSQSYPLGGVSMIPGPDFFKAAGNVGFFTGYTPERGSELWRTDGTAAGTFLVHEFYPGPDSPELGEMVSIGNVFYFVGDTDTGGKELWRSDGSIAGTQIVKAIGSGWPGSEPYGLCPQGGTLFFSADGSGGNELYKTNGTAAGTVLVKEVNNNGSSFPAYATALNSSTVLFSALDQANGTELWKTNGTAAGTVLVKNINPGTFFGVFGLTGTGSYPYGLVQRGTASTAYSFAVINGVAIFSADDGTHGRELWKSDGTSAGTVLLKDIVPGPTGCDPYSMVVVDNKVYFVVTISGSTQLWTSDGTEAGTVKVDDQVDNLDHLTLSGTDLYMVGSQSAVGTELFRLPNVRSAPFTITQSPTGQTLAVGANYTMTVATSGSAPTYLWRKDGIAIPGANKSSYTISKAAETHQGKYDVLIRIGDFEALTAVASVDVIDPASIGIIQQPLPKLALTGSSVTFVVGTVGPSPNYQWYKGTVAIGSANSDTLTLPNLQMSDAGLYKVKVTNSKGSVFSNAVQLAMVSSSNQFVPVKASTTASLTAPVVGTGLTYRWLQNGSALNNGDFSGRVSGVTTPKLTISKFNTGDQYDYTCLVSLGSQSVISGKLSPKVAAIPVIAPMFGLAPWIISGPVSVRTIDLYSQANLVGTSWNVPTSFIITGLPKGVTYDPKTGAITGRPQAGGGTNATLSIKVGNVAGMTATAINVTIPIENFPSRASGAFRGLVDRSNSTLNDNLGDYVQADVTSIGSISGKLIRGTTTYPFVSRYLDTVPGSTTGTAAVQINRPGTTSLTLDITLDGSAGSMSGTVTDNTDSASFTCVRSSWNAAGPTPNLATAYAKAYTAALQLSAGENHGGDPAYPQGDGYVVASISTAGAVSGAVRLADSTKVTFGTLLGDLGEIPLHTGAYSNTGSLHGWSQITSATGNWDSTGTTFYKAPQPIASTTRSYKGGVPLHALTLVGGTWIKPTPAVPLLGVSDSGAATAPNNAAILFTQGGIDSSGLAVSGVFDTSFRIKAPASTFVLAPPLASTGKLSLSFATIVTGEITGSFTTTGANSRVAPYYGVIVQRLNKGRGHFNLAKLPDMAQPNPLETDILSGAVEIIKRP